MQVFAKEMPTYLQNAGATLAVFTGKAAQEAQKVQQSNLEMI
jgi:hypothetical protein